MLPDLTGTDQDADDTRSTGWVALSLAHLCVCICILRTHTHIHTHTHELPILEHCSTSFKTVNKAEMPENHVQMPGETCLLPEEMPAAAATIQEGTCFINMCVVLCIIHQRSHYIVSVAPAGPHKSFPSLSLHDSLTQMLMYKKQAWKQSCFIFFKKVRDGLQRGS